jgi:hypothetical protein
MHITYNCSKLDEPGEVFSLSDLFPKADFGEIPGFVRSSALKQTGNLR